MLSRLYNGRPTIYLKLKPCRGAACTGDVCIQKIESCLGNEYIELVKANLPRVVLPQRKDPRSFKETTTAIALDEEEDAAPQLVMDADALAEVMAAAAAPPPRRRRRPCGWARTPANGGR